MKFVALALALALALACAGCALPPTDSELQAADFGPYPTDYQAIVMRFMDGYLMDGESARYKFVDPPGKFGMGGFAGKQYGYLVCVDVNAKNKFGAYVGYHRSALVIRDGRVIDAAHTDGTISDDIVQNRCAS